MKLLIASDHAGFDLKHSLIEHLRVAGYEVSDLGPAEKARCDYPDFAAQVARGVAGDSEALGVLCCGTGIGMAMAANKVHGVRAAVCSDTFSAHATREHNDANVLCLGERVVGPGLAADIVDAFLSTQFEGGRHADRVQKIMDLEG